MLVYAIKAIVEKHFNSTVKTLYSDNGGEYISLANFFQQMVSLISPLHLTHLNTMVTPKEGTFI